MMFDEQWEVVKPTIRLFAEWTCGHCYHINEIQIFSPAGTCKCHCQGCVKKVDLKWGFSE